MNQIGSAGGPRVRRGNSFAFALRDPRRACRARAVTATATLALVLGACLGRIDPPNNTADAAATADGAGLREAGFDAAFVCPSDTDGIQRAILLPRCGTSGCHVGPTAESGLDLASPGLAARVVGVAARDCAGQPPLVVAGAPGSSLLFEKVSEESPSCGQRMPTTARLSDAEIACLRAWISALPQPGTDGGAPDVAPTTCPAGQTLCGTTCVDAQHDNSNCGACGRACPSGTTCTAGACACSAPLVMCGGTCVDTRSSPANCGACGHACSAGAVCASGACTMAGCPAGQTSCGGACVDTQTSVLHCGGCGVACGAGQTCTAGRCGCAGGATLCGSVCTNTATDSSNCGACGHACAGGTACVGGSCGCAAGLTSCGGTCVDTRTSTTNCGSCGHACASGLSCSGGACACRTGFTLCGTACKEVSADRNNCGACGHVCASNTTCVAGACVACAAPREVCGNRCVDTQTDRLACGGCGSFGSTWCTHGMACSAGHCVCPPGRTMCGGDCVSLMSNDLHCGACGHACAAGTMCNAGVCGPCGATVSLATQVQPIFTAGCMGYSCHQGSGSVNLSLDSTAHSYATLVGVPSNWASCAATATRVLPRQPGHSQLINSLTTSNCQWFITMPSNGPELPAAQIDLIRAWICEGAPNN